MRLIRLWFSLDGTVNRRDYLVSGVGLISFKYVVEALALWMMTDKWLSLWQFFNPILLHRAQWFEHAPAWMPWVVVAWSLPFIWIGLSLTIRRLLDAGYSGWSGLLFLVPFINYLMMAVCARIPSATPMVRRFASEQSTQTNEPSSGMTTALSAFLATQCVALIMFVVCVLMLGTYGSSLFVATPVLMGVVHAVMMTRVQPQDFGKIIRQGQISLLGSLLILLTFALEGIICLLMVWPIAAVLMLFGNVIGIQLRGLLRPSATRWLPLVLLAIMPFVAWEESRWQQPIQREVTSSVIVDAPPEVVWRRVVSFPDLPPPSGIFVSGIACPLRARIEGSGVGAIRYCEFTTGSFVEPITAWDEPRRLAFDVTTQPPPMRELTPYAIQPPHLDGYLRSRRGEFRLISLDGGGRTRLEGSTWYDIDVHPAFYWRWWSDGLISAIHQRVLDHICKLSEADVR
jgi:uncharacterized membrane protein YhaH (DUF805 family)